MKYSKQFCLNLASDSNIYQTFQLTKRSNSKPACQCCFLFTSDLPDLMTAAGGNTAQGLTDTLQADAEFRFIRTTHCSF